MRVVVSILVATILALSSLEAKESIFFMPEERSMALSELLKKIDNSKKSIDIAIYSFTHKGISKALQNAAKRGVKVAIIYDKKSNQNNNYSTLAYLAKYKNIEAYTLEGELSKNRKYRGSMHVKLAIFDKNEVVFGSSNWSNSAFTISYELLYFTDSTKIVQKSIDFFDKTIKKSISY